MNSIDSDNEDIDKFSERYVRWQAIRIEQMGFVNNLIIGLASGILLWQSQMLLSNNIGPQIRPSFVSSAVLFIVSILFGCMLAYNRLHDFRLTARIVRSLDKFPPKGASPKTKQDRKTWRAKTKILGKLTWIMLPIQLLSFLIGLFLMVAAIT
jgi:hypothetical protein